MIDLRLGNSLDLAKELPDQSIQTIVTSPPYWGLRSYSTNPQIWQNGHELCVEHDWSVAGYGDRRAHGAGEGDWKSHFTNGNTPQHIKVKQGDVCSRCGAWRGELGLEPTPEMYVSHLVELFRELRRALKDDGTAWVNLGDSFAGGKGQSGSRGAEFQEGRNGRGESMNRGYQTLGGAKLTKPTDDRAALRSMGIKPKDLVGIPWRVAFALQADGWYLRSDIIWHKPNPMPESVTDRPTKSHEYIFLLSKSAKYYYDADAVKEKSVDPESFTGRRKRNAGQMNRVDPLNYKMHGSILKDGTMRSGQVYPTRNRRSVWTVTTRPFKGAHFATFPEALIEPCILAGARAGDIVLDPFSGAGTTGVVAKRHNRSYIGFELNPEYLEMSQARIDKVQVALPLEVERC